jgi:hypothetical protein
LRRRSSPLERLKPDYGEAKTGVAEEVRGRLRALGVEPIIVTPLEKGWSIEGGADIARVIARGSDAPVSTMGSSYGSTNPMVIRFVKVIGTVSTT